MAFPESPLSKYDALEPGEAGSGPGGAERQASGSQDFRLLSEELVGFGGLTGAESPQQELFSAAPFAESTQNPCDALQFLAGDIKDARRAVWEATGYVLPIAGGQESSSSANEPHEDAPDWDTAKRRIDEILSTKIPKKNSPEWKEHRIRVMELAYLRKLYPDLYEEVRESRIEKIQNRKD